jgi:carboxyl-terminal processing protease
LIIDLRNNRGGLQSAMQEMVSQLMPLGVYGSTIDKSGDSTVISSSVNAQLGVATVVLVNHHTAGEAEFIAGAMQEQSLATVMGVTTAGKAKYQEYIKVNLDNSAMKLTNGYYSLLKGGSYEGKGIVPNKEVTLTEEESAIFPLLTEETDPQLKAALDQLSAAEGGSTTSTTTTTAADTTTTTTAAAK